MHFAVKGIHMSVPNEDHQHENQVPYSQGGLAFRVFHTPV